MYTIPHHRTPENFSGSPAIFPVHHTAPVDGRNFFPNRKRHTILRQWRNANFLETRETLRPPLAIPSPAGGTGGLRRSFATSYCFNTIYTTPSIRAKKENVYTGVYRGGYIGDRHGRYGVPWTGGQK